MAGSRKKAQSLVGLDTTFYRELLRFYRENKGSIRSHYHLLTRTLLDYNDPDKPRTGQFLRRPQFEALEIYIFLKEYIKLRPVHDIFADWYNRRNGFEKRGEVLGMGEQLVLHESLTFNEEAYAAVFKRMKAVRQEYPNYIFALTMGVGKTLLMATCIFYDFVLARKFPDDPLYCHNALIFAPDKTVLQSLREIEGFDFSRVLPPEHANWLQANLKLQYLEEDKNITVYEQTGTRLFYFAFNVEKAPWDNQTLRQAVACAIDRSAVLEAAVYGKGTPQTTILNRGLWGFYDDMEGFDYDVERAKALMAEAGYPDGGITTTLSYATGTPYEQIATIIQANLADIGITVTLEPMETATLKSACVDGSQELFLWRWNEDSKVDFVYRDLFYTGSGSNYHHYGDAKADEMIDIVATEKDADKRLEAAQELQTYLVDACPQVPLYIANLVVAYNKDLQGQYFYGGGNHDWRHAYIAQ